MERREKKEAPVIMLLKKNYGRGEGKLMIYWNFCDLFMTFVNSLC